MNKCSFVRVYSVLPSQSIVMIPRQYIVMITSQNIGMIPRIYSHDSGLNMEALIAHSNTALNSLLPFVTKAADQYLARYYMRPSGTLWSVDCIVLKEA